MRVYVWIYMNKRIKVVFILLLLILRWRWRYSMRVLAMDMDIKILYTAGERNRIIYYRIYLHISISKKRKKWNLNGVCLLSEVRPQKYIHPHTYEMTWRNFKTNITSDSCGTCFICCAVFCILGVVEWSPAWYSTYYYDADDDVDDLWLVF